MRDQWQRERASGWKSEEGGRIQTQLAREWVPRKLRQGRTRAQTCEDDPECASQVPQSELRAEPQAESQAEPRAEAQAWPPAEPPGPQA